MSLSLGWYAKNRARSYPIEGYATALDNNGKPFPESLIADLRIRFPGNDDSRAFIRYAAAGATLTLVIAADDQDIASATINRDKLVDWLPVPITPIVPGVYGYVVFGAVDLDGQWEFDGVEQSGLSIRAASPQPYFDLPAKLSRIGFDALSGPVIRLTGEGDIQVQRQKRVLQGKERDAVVLSLANQLEREVLAEYAGQCGRRPESRTCQDPQPIEDINGIVPDCCGRIFIEFRGCVDMLPLSDSCGVVIRCDVSTDEACPPSKRLPNEIGELPDEEEESPDEEPGEDPEDCEDEPNPRTNQEF